MASPDRLRLLICTAATTAIRCKSKSNSPLCKKNRLTHSASIGRPFPPPPKHLSVQVFLKQLDWPETANIEILLRWLLQKTLS